MRGIRSHTLVSFLTFFFFFIPLLPSALALSLSIASKSSSSFTVNWSLQNNDPKEFYLLAIPWPGTEAEVRKKRMPSRDEILDQFGKDGNSGAMLERRTEVKAGGRKDGTSTVNSPKEGLVLVAAAKGFDKKAQLLGEEWVTLGNQPPQPPQSPPPAQTSASQQPASSTNGGGTPNTETTNPTNTSPTSTPTDGSAGGGGDAGQNTDPSNSQSSAVGSHQTVAIVTFIPGVGTTTLSFATGVDDNINTNLPNAPTNTDLPGSNPNTGTDQSQNLTSTSRTNLPLILGLCLTIPLLLLALLFFVFFWLPRKRRMERRRRHLEQSAAYASNVRGGDPYAFGGSGVGGEARESAQSVFGGFRRWRSGGLGREGEGGQGKDSGRGFNPALMVARAWSVNSRSSAPSLASDSGGGHDEKAGLHGGERY